MRIPARSLQIIAPAALSVALFWLALFHILLPSLERDIMTRKRNMLREMTTVTWTLLRDYEERVASGELTLEDAQSRAAKRLRNIRYGPEGKDYFWINDMDSIMVMHPYRNDLEGKNISKIADPNGKLIFVEVIETVKAKEAGFVEYGWQWKDDATRIVPKLSYVRGFAPWGWIIGTGMYLEDVRMEIAAVTGRLTRVCLMILAAVSALSLYVVCHSATIERKRRQAEAELTDYRDHLEELVETRTTELAATHEALRESERRLADIVDFLPEATFVIDRRGVVITWNRAMTELTGVAAEEMLGRGDYEYALHFYGERRPMLIDEALDPERGATAYYPAMEQQGDILTTEGFATTFRGGAHLWGMATALRDSQGRVVGAIESIRDTTSRVQAEEELSKHREHLEEMVSERTAELANANEQLRQEIADRRRAEEALSKEEERYRTIVETAGEGVWILDKDERTSFVNRQMAAMIGYSIEEIIGRRVTDFLDEEDRADFLSRRKPRREGVNEQYDLRFRRKDGSDVWTIINASPILDADRCFAGAFGMIMDITDRKHAENALRESEEKFRLLSDQALMGIHIIRDGVLEYVNQATAAMCGYSVAEMLSWAPNEFIKVIHPDDRPMVMEQARRKQNGSSDVVLNYEWRLLTSSGLVRRVESFSKTITYGDAPADFVMMIDVTERRQAEEAMLESQRRYREVFEGSRDGFVIVDTQGRITDANQAYCEMVGYSLDELRSMKDFYQITPQRWHDWEQSEIFRHRLLQIGYSGVYEKEYMRSDGNIIPVEIQAYAHRDEHGNPLYLWGIARDITERRRAEDDLAATTSFLDTIVDMSPFPMWVSDPAGTLIRTNHSLREALNLTEKQLVGVYNVLADANLDAQGLKPAVVDVFEKHEPARFSMSWKPGEVGNIDFGGARDRYVDISMFPILSAAGELTNVVCQWVDITERHRAEEELRRLRNYLSNVIDSMPSIMIGVDAEGRVTQWNRQAEQATGMPLGQAQGQLLNAVYPPIQSAMVMVDQAVRSGQARKDPKVVQEIAGERRFCDITVYPLVTDGNQGAVVRVDDVTDRVRIEEIMVQTEKMMSVGGLAAGMAHEINNPLGGIIQGAQNIERRLSPELAMNAEVARECGLNLDTMRLYLEKREIPKFLAGIRESGARAARIVANMLQFSRKSEPHRVPADLAELIDRTVELAANDYDLKKKFDFRHIEIVRDYDPDLPHVPVVTTEIEQVILNLLRNAAHAVQQAPGNRHPRFVLRTRLAGDMARIEIEDNGPGMSEEVRRRVFEPFFTTKTVGTGTGLGLSVSYMIITNNHQGRMVVESAPGIGARFIIELPLAHRESGTAALLEKVGVSRTDETSRSLPG